MKKTVDMQEKSLFLITSIYLVAYAIDPFIWIMAFKKFLKPKFKNRIYYVLCFSGVYALILGKQALLFFTDSNLTVFFFPIMITYIFTVSKVLFEGSLKKRISVFVAVYLLSIAVDGGFAIVLMCMHVDPEEIMTYGFVSGIIMLIVRMTNLILYFSLKNFYEIIKEKSVRPVMIIVYAIMFVGSYAVLTLFFEDLTRNESILYCIYSIQVTLVIIITSFIFVYLKDQATKDKEAIEKARLSEGQLALINLTKETYEEIKAIKHDLRHHYKDILNLNQANDRQGIEKYLLTLNAQLNSTEDRYMCNNLIVDVAIYEKLEKAKKEKIEFSPVITVEKFTLSDPELSSLLNNILDNAFEAVSKVVDGEKRVKLIIKKINEQDTMFYCENTYNKTAYMDIPFLSSIKKGCNHGYGTKIVKSIAEGHEGSAEYWKDEKNFYVQVVLR